MSKQQCVTFSQTLVQFHYCRGRESATCIFCHPGESFVDGTAEASCVSVCERKIDSVCVGVRKGVLNHCSTNGLPLGRHGFEGVIVDMRETRTWGVCACVCVAVYAVCHFLWQLFSFNAELMLV